jgi:hypothetical protein
MVIGAVLVSILALVGIGVAVYNAGVDQGVAEGLRRSGQSTEVVRVIGPRFGHGYGYGFGFFPFGLILFPLLIIGIVLLVRGAFWRGRWGGPGWGGPGWGPGGPGYGYGPWGGRAGFDEYHRRLHEQSTAPAGPGDDPAGGGTRETPTDPGTV